MAASTTPAVSEQPLVITSASKRFGETVALAGASFDLRRGELVGLLGPNGAGKTTMIKAIAGRLALDAGTIRLFGRTVSRKDPRPEIGVVPQELAVYPRHTAKENLEVFGRLYGVGRQALPGRVAWALAWSGLEDRAREPVTRFSGGMKRRLNIACSLLHEPTVVLLDEPTVGVNPQSRERIYEMLGALRQAGVSIVLTTHHLEEAEHRCDRVVIIDHGQTVASGTVEELVAGTLGPARTLTITLERPLRSQATLPVGAVLSEDGCSVRASVRDLSQEVATLLGILAAAGETVSNFGLSGASLQDVFIAVTGRELRE